MNGDDSNICLVDMHCHVDLYSSPEAVIVEAEKSRVWTVAVTNAPSVFFHTRNLCRGLAFVQPSVGLHPELVISHGGEIDKLRDHLEQTRYVGEIGLDYVTTDKEVRHKQQEVFRAILERCAKYGDRILSVHSRRASADVVAMVGRNFPGAVVLHWFSGPVKDVKAAADYGFFFSLNPAMLRSQAGQRLIAAMPPNRVLTETDGPFVKVGPRPAQPSDVKIVVKDLARIWQVPEEEARLTVVSNLRKLIGDV